MILDLIEPFDGKHTSEIVWIKHFQGDDHTGIYGPIQCQAEGIIRIKGNKIFIENEDLDFQDWWSRFHSYGISLNEICWWYNEDGSEIYP